MALYENDVTLKGFIGKEAVSKTIRQQRNFVVLSLATKSGYKYRQTNQWVNHTEWHRIVAFGNAAEYAKQLKKGDYVEVKGELHSNGSDGEAGEGKQKVRGWEIRASIVRKLPTPTKPGENLDAEPVSDGDAA